MYDWENTPEMVGAIALLLPRLSHGAHTALFALGNAHTNVFF